VLGRLQRWFQFQVERFLVRGAYYRLMLICLAIGVVSVAAGGMLYWGEGRAGGADMLDATWWAFLRLTDPGYLGDDEGTLRRAVSTALTVAGYVLFLGALVATMTQGLNDQIRRLERGFTPVAMRNHIVVIGWNASTPELVAELTEPSHGVRRFLERYGVRGLRIAVLAEEVGPHLDQALRERLGKRYSAGSTVLRTGSALQKAHLERVDFRNAAVIVFSIPERHRGQEEASDDAQLAKSVVTLARALGQAERVPVVVASVADPLKLEVIRAAYPHGRTELFATSQIVARLMVRFARQPGLLRVMDEISSQQYGSEIYIHRLKGLEGTTFRELLLRFERAIVLGTVLEDAAPGKRGRVQFVGGLDERVPSGASLVVLAEDGTLVRSSRGVPNALPALILPPRRRQPLRSLLVVGWNHHVLWMLRELDQILDEGWQVLIVSATPVAERLAALQQSRFVLQRVVVEHRVCDITAPKLLAEQPLTEYETLLVPASDRLESAEDADARSLLVYHLLRARLRELGAKHVRILVELRDPANADLFERSETEAVPSAMLVTHLLAQVALRPELRVVLDTLLSPAGPEFEIISPVTLGLQDETVSFAEIMVRGAQYGVVVLGVRVLRRTANSGVIVNPGRGEEFTLGEADGVIVLESPPKSPPPPGRS
jgi:Trk K+ transport system NAD-binding subunit